MSLLSLSKSSERLHHKRGNPLKDSAILSINDYERIKNYSCFQSKDIILNNNLILQEQHLNNKFNAEELKKKMIDYDNLNRVAPAQSRNLHKSSSVISLYKSPKDNEDDCIKEMNQIISNAKVATIRDRQLEERKRLDQLYKHKEKRLDYMMELERLKEIKFQEVKEIEIKRQQKEGSKIINEQIKEADFERVRLRDLKEKERLQIIRQVEEMKLEDKKRAQQTKMNNYKLYQEAVIANKNALFFKEIKRIEDKDLDLKLLKYSIEKDKREADLIMEKKRIHDAKEREVQRLREKQEKNIDKKIEYDAMRAKRDYQEKEKKTREQEIRDMERCKELKRELVEENDKQLKNKHIRLLEEAEKEKGYIAKIIEQNIKANEKEEREKEEYKWKLNKNCEEVKEQIRNKEDKTLTSKKETIEEGIKIKRNNEEYNKYIEAVKQEKLNELIKLNLRPEYVNELRKFKAKKI